ncbi:Maf family protein [Amnibacterium endophyticum]|uniref:Nucleoside triphosphate pyrophosphatase n=1 Tax=Amnibacterium endophyticum TaxID=2109337 RepID=A0ABW4LFU2_9MICO
MRLVLASTSPARLALLRAAGIEPEAVPPGVDEEAEVAAEEARLGRALPAEELVLLLARLKAEAVAERLGTADALVLGGDSAFAFDGRVFGKPHTPAAALARWRAQRGHSGVLHSGHWLVDARHGTGSGSATSAEVRFAGDLADAELEAYVASGEPLEVAGAFTIDGLAGAFIDRIEGDPSTVVGLSLPALRRLVTATGTPWPALWNR